VALLLKMVEERTNQLWRELPECHGDRRFPELALSEFEEQHERVAVGGDGPWAQRPLLGEILGKVRGPDLGPWVFLQGSAGKPRKFNRKQVERSDAAERALAAAGILRRYQF
jgi:hypothetical protein